MSDSDAHQAVEHARHDHRLDELERQESSWRWHRRMTTYLDAMEGHIKNMTGEAATQAKAWLEWGRSAVQTEHPFVDTLAVPADPEFTGERLEPPNAPVLDWQLLARALREALGQHESPQRPRVQGRGPLGALAMPANSHDRGNSLGPLGPLRLRVASDVSPVTPSQAIFTALSLSDLRRRES